MFNKPEKCCGVGTHECQVPIIIDDKVRGIDYCIADIVAALNASNIKTVASCCGHNIMDGEINLEDGRTLIIKRVRHE